MADGDPDDTWRDTMADLVESAFGLICNVDSHSATTWKRQTGDWTAAADRWMDRYYRVVLGSD